jgi:hypothetical protein
MRLQSVFLFLLLFSNSLLFPGFTAQTLVKTVNGYTPIRYLNVGDRVLARNSAGVEIQRKITHKKSCVASRYVRIIVGDVTIVAHAKQRFYLPDKGRWRLAQNLVVGDMLLGADKVLVPVQEVTRIDESIKLYDITVKGWHNFLVSEHDILVHNFAPAFFVGLSWAVGAGIEFLGATISVVSVGGLAYCTYDNYSRYRDREAFFNNPRVEALHNVASSSGEFTHLNHAEPAEAHLNTSQVDGRSSGLQTAARVGTAFTAVGGAVLGEYKKKKAKDKEESKAGEQAKAASRGKKEEPICRYHRACLPENASRCVYRDKHIHGEYKDAPYHHFNSKGSKNPAPLDGQWALDNSIPVGDATDSKQRVGLSCEQIVILKWTSENLWHGFVVTWKEARSEVHNTLIAKGWANRRGKISWPSWARLPRHIWIPWMP